MKLPAAAGSIVVGSVAAVHDMMFAEALLFIFIFLNSFYNFGFSI